MNGKTELAELVRRIILRDPHAEEEMILRYKDGVFQIIYQIVHDHSTADDLSQDTLMKALEKIRRGDVREPDRLSGFICRMARFIALDYIRNVRAAKVEEINAADQVVDPAPDPCKQALEKEMAEIVRKVISEMENQRDREILFRYYIVEEDKDDICAALKLTREQFNRVIFRARQRYKEIYMKLTGEVLKEDK